ncbi:putative aromatic acid decarboxylase [Caloramator mitchellensis]|uniref:Flavin prenyltransferase UbiX n=1 Tax=Caloramator mitchellensis TaxID=908809 RepID=A0A0R3K2D2_CALMK|nr:UbiX family flavin prenyltransferase [Caloramator mitchellensis]KRQ87588.1 putative aromatic acid decarboxylase [Caloramator mitchellensis]
MRLIVGISGGSCAIYGIGLLKVLKELNIETHLVVTTMGEYVVEHECGFNLEELKKLATYYHDNKNLAAPIASGSFKTDGMVVVPCSMKTLSSIANGYSDNLLTRAADVCIKEGRRVILVPRETPLSAIHLENMLKLVRCGVKVMPASPGFYNQPQTINDLVAFMVGRILDQLDIEHSLYTRWGE